MVDTQLGLRVAQSRMPFRYGTVTVREAPILTLEVTIETERGYRACGYAADFLAYRWFDKRPHKSMTDNVADLLSAVRLALAACQGQTAYRTAFDLWWDSLAEMKAAQSAHDLNDLTTSFGVSMPERAVIDALGRLLQRPVADLVASQVLGVDLSRLDPQLADFDIRSRLPEPLTEVWVRHTVGLLDPVSRSDLVPDEAIEDGLPETLEDYLRVDGLRYLKVKVSGRREDDLARLTSIAEVLSRSPTPCRVTLDGNEQYRDLTAFEELVEGLRTTPELRPLYDAILFIEQPLERSVSLSAEASPTLQRIRRHKPVIIDEADGTLDAFKLAMRLGYSGVSHKNCKGIYRSLLNFGRVQRGNEALGGDYFLSAEDLTNLPVVPLQADLAMVALLGIPHVERNGHHYFPGLRHLSPEEQTHALLAHPDLYETLGQSPALRIRDGRISVRSLQVPGFGFSFPPAMDRMMLPDAFLKGR